jgi:Flp pilus assembly secretin CpaC
LFDDKINSLNLSVKTENSVVYLMGTAQTQEEADYAVSIARDVSGVKKVMNYLQVRDMESSAGSKAEDSGEDVQNDSENSEVNHDVTLTADADAIDDAESNG